MSIDKLAETIRSGLRVPGQPRDEESIDPASAAGRVREAFVVIDRDDLPEVVPDAEASTGLRATVAYGIAGRVATAYITPAEQGFDSGTPEWHEARAKAHLAAAEYLRANPPVDEKAVGELASWMGALAGVSTNEVQWAARMALARRMVADGWKREAKP